MGHGGVQVSRLLLQLLLPQLEALLTLLFIGIYIVVRWAAGRYGVRLSAVTRPGHGPERDRGVGLSSLKLLLVNDNT